MDLHYQEFGDKSAPLMCFYMVVDWMLKVAHFRDPAGNLIEIYENL